ncbi:MAG: protein kinase [Blastocatellia bacterium]|nr:protein kinase [Blastocatellia bacterium]MBL8194321.1 protein kinase [Blastocatellia bacterium]
MESDLSIGTVINEKYRIEALIGEGGMGKVFRVSHLELNKTFALKLMKFDSSNIGSGSARVSRFRREASTLARLSHPNIVSIIDYGIMKTTQLPFIVMEYIEGVTLRKMLNLKGTLGESQAINIINQLCLALHQAHEVGVIHRDLKPENIIIQELAENYLSVRVVDFGIAKLLNSEFPSIEEEIITTGNAPGTLRYIAPEQFFKLGVDARTDVFSICLILYEMLTGEVPPVMIGGFKPLKEMRPGVTPELSDVVERGLSQSPNERPQSVLALKKVLDEINQAGLDKNLKETKKQNFLVTKPKTVKTNENNSTSKIFTETNKIEQKSKIPWVIALVFLLLIGAFTGVKIYQKFYIEKQLTLVLPELVTIKGETFFMGSDNKDEYSRPAHKVTLKTFLVSKNLITNRQYAEFVRLSNYPPPSFWAGNEPQQSILNKPITQVSWNDATAFCSWLSKQTGKKYRLLSEAEWEYIAANKSNLNINELAEEYFEWTSSEFTLYEGSKLKLPDSIMQNNTFVFRGKDEKVGNDPITDRLWQLKNYTEPKLSFRLAMSGE